MVAGQIKPNKVVDERVIAAISEVEREAFVPRALKGVAYLDEDIEVAPGRYLLEPMIFARLADAAGIGPQDAILDVGCATGYSSAVLGRLGAAVVALEEDAELAALATEKLADAGADNVAVVTGALADGVPDQGPFDVIFVNGAVGVTPRALYDQLAEGGRMVYVRQDAGDRGVGRGHLVTKVDGVVGGRDLFDAFARLLPGFEPAKAFKF